MLNDKRIIIWLKNKKFVINLYYILQKKNKIIGSPINNNIFF